MLVKCDSCGKRVSHTRLLDYRFNNQELFLCFHCAALQRCRCGLVRPASEFILTGRRKPRAICLTCVAGPRRCPACGCIKPITEFSRNGQTDGIYTYCRNCNGKKRAERIRNAPGHHDDDDIKLQLESQADLCFWCSEPMSDDNWLMRMNVDHVIPVSRGGSNWPANLVCACFSCNQHKKDKLPFLEWQPRNPLQSWHGALDEMKGNEG